MTKRLNQTRFFKLSSSSKSQHLGVCEWERAEHLGKMLPILTQSLSAYLCSVSWSCYEYWELTSSWLVPLHFYLIGLKWRGVFFCKVLQPAEVVKNEVILPNYEMDQMSSCYLDKAGLPNLQLMKLNATHQPWLEPAEHLTQTWIQIKQATHSGSLSSHHPWLVGCFKFAL